MSAIPAYIWTEPDTLTEHVVADGTYEAGQDATVCGITYESLPVTNQAEMDAGYDTPDKDWYYDHDRDDVVRCLDGCFA